MNVRAVQAVYMPLVPQLLAESQRVTMDRTSTRSQPHADNDRPESSPLFLPSSLSVDQREMCSAGLSAMEVRLREGQLSSALDTLRSSLHVKARLLKFKSRNIRHQNLNTRAREKIDSNEMKVLTAAEKYRAAWQAMKRLVGDGPWVDKWRELKKTDVRCLQEDNGQMRGMTDHMEGRRTVSWIWHSADGNSGAEQGLTEGKCKTMFGHGIC